MKKVLTIFFVTLGVIFFVLILVAVYFFVTDPLNLRPLLSGGIDTVTPVTPGDGETSAAAGTVDENPLLNESQEAALERIGVDPAAVPSEITPEQESCFRTELGDARVDEIVAGDMPTVAEYFKAKDCI